MAAQRKKAARKKATRKKAPAARRKPKKKATKRPRGRPTKFIKAVRWRVLRALCTSMPRRDAAAYAGIDYQTMRNWIKRGGEALAKVDGDWSKIRSREDREYAKFAEACHQAEARWKFRALRRIHAAGAWQSDFTLLERRDPEHFARRRPDEGGAAEDAAGGAILALLERLQADEAASKP